MNTSQKSQSASRGDWDLADESELNHPEASEPVNHPQVEHKVDFAAPQQTSRASRRVRMHCFECNREDGHFLAGWPRSMFSFLLGLTFGLILLVGPYRCQCCGSRRWGRYNFINPRYWFSSARSGPVRRRQA